MGILGTKYARKMYVNIFYKKIRSLPRSKRKLERKYPCKTKLIY